MFDPGFYPQPGAESVVACSFDLDGLILLFVLPALTSSGGGWIRMGVGWGRHVQSVRGGSGATPAPPCRRTQPASISPPGRRIQLTTMTCLCVASLPRMAGSVVSLMAPSAIVVTTVPACSLCLI